MIGAKTAGLAVVAAGIYAWFVHPWLIRWGQPTGKCSVRGRRESSAASMPRESPSARSTSITDRRPWRSS